MVAPSPTHMIKSEAKVAQLVQPRPQTLKLYDDSQQRRVQHASSKMQEYYVLTAIPDMYGCNWLDLLKQKVQKYIAARMQTRCPSPGGNEGGSQLDEAKASWNKAVTLGGAANIAGDHIGATCPTQIPVPPFFVIVPGAFGNLGRGGGLCPARRSQAVSRASGTQVTCQHACR